MSIFAGISNLLQQTDPQKQSEKKNTLSTRIGAKMTAQISRDLGGGKYLLRLGNQTVTVQSSASFREKQSVDLQVVSTSDGNIEMEISSQDNSTAIARLAQNDTATITTPVQLSLPLADTAAITTQTARQTAGRNDITLSVEVEKNPPAPAQTATASSAATSSPDATAATESAARSRNIIAQNTQNAVQTETVRIYLPDGKVIIAEIIPEDTASSADNEEISEEDNGENRQTGAEKNQTAENTAGTADSKTAGSADNARTALRNFLTELAGRLASLHTQNTEAVSPDTPAATLKIQNITIPLLLENIADSTSGQLNLNLPLKDLARILPAIITDPSLLAVTSGQTGTAQLSYTGPGTAEQLPLTAENTSRLETLFQRESDYQFSRIALGSESTLQGLLIEELTAAGTAQTPQEPAQDLARAQESPQRLNRLLQQKNITPSNVTREAAAALLDNRLPVTRDNVQSLLALSAGRQGTERAAFLQAGARLLALDIPLSPALAAGVDTLDNTENFLTGGISRILPSLDSALAAAAEIPVTPAEETPQPATGAAATAENQLPGSENSRQDQTAGTPDTVRQLTNSASATNIQTAAENPAPLQNQSSISALITSARDTLSGIPILIETLAEDHANIDAALQNNKAEPVLARELQDFVSTSARERLGRVEGLIEKATMNILQNDPVLSRLSGALDSVLNKLGNQPSAEELSAGQNRPAETQPKTDSPVSGKLQNFLSNASPNNENMPVGKETLDIRSFLQSLNLSRTPAAHPGLGQFPDIWNKVETDPTTIRNADSGKIKETIEQILKAESPQQAKEIAEKNIKNIDRDTLRTLSSALQELEKEEIQKHPALKHLREASSELRDIGRALVAQKAENLAASRNDPASFSASIPFNFNNNEGGEDGQLSMHYRRTKSRKGDWQQRVVLDLNMSVLGNIIGDIQFYDRQLNINLVSTNADTVKILASEENSLLDGLNDIGFSATLGVRLLEKPQLSSDERQEEQKSRHLLDIRI